MPYIKKEDRKYANRCVKEINWYFDLTGFTGKLNYILFKTAKQQIKNYASAQQFIGELECAKQEIYRRIIAPYEDKKIKENGDVE